MKPAEGLSPEAIPESAGWRNVGGKDQLLRVVTGAAMLALPECGAVAGVAGIALGIFGWVPLVTGLAGWCPFYALLGIGTRRCGWWPAANRR